MIRLTHLGLAVVIAGLVLLLKGSSILVTTATAKTQTEAREKGEGQKSQPETHRRTLHRTRGRRFLRITPQEASEQFL